MITSASYHQKTVYGQEREFVRALESPDICDCAVTAPNRPWQLAASSFRRITPIADMYSIIRVIDQAADRARTFPN